MVFSKILVKDLKLEYEGLLDVAELYKVMTMWFREKSFDKLDNMDVNVTKPDGSKHIEFELEPWRKWTDYHKQRFRVRTFITDCKNVEVEKNGVKVKMQHAKVTIFFDIYLDLDHVKKSTSPMSNFIQIIFDKIFYKPINEKYENLTIEDTNHLYNTLKRYFNMPKSGDFMPRYESRD